LTLAHHEVLGIHSPDPGLERQLCRSNYARVQGKSSKDSGQRPLLLCIIAMQLATQPAQEVRMAMAALPAFCGSRQAAMKREAVKRKGQHGRTQQMRGLRH